MPRRRGAAAVCGDFREPVFLSFCFLHLLRSPPRPCKGNFSQFKHHGLPGALRCREIARNPRLCFGTLQIGACNIQSFDDMPRVTCEELSICSGTLDSVFNTKRLIQVFFVVLVYKGVP